jgi:transposase-like protein
MRKKQYSDDFQEQALRKVFARQHRTIASVAAELNLSTGTLKNWMKETKRKNISAQPAKRPQDWTASERLFALQESHALEGEALHAWCRSRGVFAHNLTQWQQDFCGNDSKAAAKKESDALRVLQRENTVLQRQLLRKDKALAEAAALLILQKKFQALLAGEEE